MKKMKLFCGFLIGLMIFSSCSNDDDSIPETISIIGVWKPIKQVNVCSTGSEETNDFSTCEQMTRLTFSSNGTISQIFFEDENGDCVEYFSRNGTWSINGDILTIISDGVTSMSTIFELTNNTLQIGYYEDSNSDPCDNGNVSHYYTEFLRVE